MDPHGNPLYELCTATRLHGNDTDTADLSRLLDELTGVVYDNAGKLDPRLHLADNYDNEKDPDLSGRFIGFGISSTDTEQESWDKISSRLTSPMKVPSRAYICLTDRTVIYSHREHLLDATIHVRSQPHLGWLDSRFEVKAWEYNPEEDAHTGKVWQQLRLLVHLLDMPPDWPGWTLGSLIKLLKMPPDWPAWRHPSRSQQASR